jgi:flavin reductase (DIM6/NTAB) family NADH-FMN oxidoreductase RutF
MAIEREQFKAALRRWTSGVTIVTTEWRGQRIGMTASAFSSVSIDPPRVLVCPDRRSKTLPFLRRSGVFTVNVLASDQEALSSRFAAAGNEDMRFEGLVCSTGKTGTPRLPGALVALDCRTVSLHEAGDHVICVGEVMDADVPARGAPLVYYEGGYRTLEAGARAKKCF